MSLKAELETWVSALKAYDEEDFEKALDLFSRIADSSKILTNMGLIYATLGEHEAAVEQFNSATRLDQYLAVAYFQCGVSNFLLGHYDLAFRDFEEALLYLRGNQAINYDQLGLKFKLYSAEVLFNKGLSQIYLGRVDEGLRDMQEARAEKATDEHNVIDDALADRGEGYTVFSIPVGVLYRPSENKIKNSKAKDYMGKAVLIATDNTDEMDTGFSGVSRRNRGYTGTGAPVPDDGPGLSRSNTVPAPRTTVDDTRPDTLMRSRTAVATANAPGAGLRRSATMASARQGGPGSALGSGSGMGDGQGTSPVNSGPARGLSIRKNGPMGQNGSAKADAPPTPPTKSNASQGPRLTEIYDDYIEGYNDQPVPPLPAPPANRVAAWARSNAQPGMTPSRAPSSRAPSAYGAYSSSGSLRRKPTRRTTGGSISGRVKTMNSYEEEEEGYVSGDYEESYELMKIRVKLYYQDDVRGMAMGPEMSWEEFSVRVSQKFDRPFEALSIKFKDEDGGKVSLRDDSDFELAIETARELAKGKPEGRLEMWVSDA